VDAKLREACRAASREEPSLRVLARIRDIVAYNSVSKVDYSAVVGLLDVLAERLDVSVSELDALEST
jgi:hypothetical protein